MRGKGCPTLTPLPPRGLPAEHPLDLDLDGARNLFAALTELVEAVEEGTR